MTGNKKTLLVVEPPEYLDELTSILLRKFTDIELVSASDRVTATMLARQYSPNVVFIDLVISAQNNCSFLKSLTNHKMVPEIIITAKSLEAPEMEKVSGFKIANFVIKPFKPDERFFAAKDFLASAESKRTTKSNISDTFSKLEEEQKDKDIEVLYKKERSRRKQAETELEKLRLIAERSRLTIIITDINGCIEYVNPMFSRSTGYGREEVIGKNPRILKSGHHSEKFYQRLWETIKSGREWRGTFVNRRKDGSILHERFLIIPAKDANNQVVNFIAIKEDITDELRREEANRRARNELASKIEERTAELLNELEVRKVKTSVQMKDASPMDGNKILVADDDILIRKLLIELLGKNNNTYLEAENGQEAIELFKSEHPDLVLVDCRMPKPNGFEVCKTINDLPEGKNVPVIMITGLHNPESVEKALEAGAEDYITKPISRDLLRQRVTAALQKRIEAEEGNLPVETDEEAKDRITRRIAELRREIFSRNTLIQNSTRQFVKAFIASDSSTSANFIAKACDDHSVEPILLRNPHELLGEMESCQPGIIFLQDTILEKAEHNLITQIKTNDILSDCFIVIYTSQEKGSDYAFSAGADFFLPVPFIPAQVDTVFRQVLSLPKKIMFVGDSDGDMIELHEQLLEHKFDMSWVENGSKAVEAVMEIFPDLILTRYKLADMKGSELCRLIKLDGQLAHINVLVQADDNVFDIEKECFDVGVREIIPPFGSISRKMELISSVVAPPTHGEAGKVLLLEENPLVRGLISKLLKQEGLLVVSHADFYDIDKLLADEVFDIILLNYRTEAMKPGNLCTELQKHENTRDIPLLMFCEREDETEVKKRANLLNISETIVKPFNHDDLINVVKKIIASTRREQERLELSKYVPTDAIRHVGDIISGVKGGEVESKFISILFSDISSFTPRCERLSPQVIVELLNNYFDLMVAVIQRNHGIVDKFIGDEIVARFDSGLAEEDAKNAISATREMFTTLKKFNEKAAEPIEARIGVNSGDVVLGNIGSSKHRLDYTMIGDNVNVTKRLEQEAPVMGCLVAESTCKLAREKRVGEKQLFTVKGRKKPVTAYPLIVE